MTGTGSPGTSPPEPTNGVASLPRQLLHTGRVTFDTESGGSFVVDLVEAFQYITVIEEEIRAERAASAASATGAASAADAPFAHIPRVQAWVKRLTNDKVSLTPGEADYLWDTIPGLYADFRRRRVERWFPSPMSPSSTGSTRRS